MKISKEDTKWILFALLAVAFIAWSTTKATDNRKIIREKYLIVKGRIVDFYKVGVHETKYVTYKYKVNGKTYKREINLSDKILDSFDEDNPYTYSDYCFWVIYEPQNPNNSLINLSSSCSCDSSLLPFSEPTLKSFK